MKKKLFGLFIGTALLLAACGGGDEAADNNNKDSGGSTASTAEQIFQQNCASCHGQDLEGKIGPSLQKVGSKYSKDEIKQIIEKGRGGMPGGLIQGENVDKVAEWLASKK
ncbi:cytochrome c551 [Thermaerobacillus caldiproteolyticus]|uniref:Cytochrome c551 n=1 Tax=Thermaerobacillus caldiproteolyticus TaxID=247480 RepID=A0A7W0BZN0_9BACL|nr:cytochrome c [Anoxybacillus caldiproteolyticus]MBA2875785.1 cytochrome c551 [Anoxybacillus caldiproteolyticus]QPA30679.1 cytochrome c [Anoxybacillus caldiproteolyticus]